MGARDAFGDEGVADSTGVDPATHAARALATLALGVLLTVAVLASANAWRHRIDVADCRAYGGRVDRGDCVTADGTAHAMP